MSGNEYCYVCGIDDSVPDAQVDYYREYNKYLCWVCADYKRNEDRLITFEHEQKYWDELSDKEKDLKIKWAIR